MTLFDLLGTEVESPEGPVRIEAMFASLPPSNGIVRVSTVTRFHGEVTDREGRRWQAIVSDDRAELLRPTG